MRPKVAIARIKSFEERFGKPHLYLAYHAAFPLALTPELLYSLWAKFQQDIHGELLNIPWEAVADILLSGLCQEVGYQLYEIDSVVRNELLKRLKADEKFCDNNSHQDRILQLSDFLLEYVERQLNSEDVDVRDFAQAQHWTALAYAKPGKAVEQIAQMFRQLQKNTSESNTADKTEILRLASLVETFAEPLAEAKLEPLLVYARGMASFSRDNLEEATAQLSNITEEGAIKIAGEEFPIPEPIQEKLGKPSVPTQNFSGKKLRGKSFKGQDLTGTNFSHTDLRGTNFTDANLVGANFSYAKTGLQRRWAFGLMFCCFLLSVLSITAAALLGSLLGTFLTDSGSEKLKISTHILLVTSSISLIFVFAVTCIFNFRKGWRSLLQKSLVLTLLSTPIALAIGILLTFFFGLRFPSDVNNQSSLTAGLLSLVGFSLCCFWTIRKGLNKAWIGASLALMGSCCLIAGVGFGVAFAWNSIKALPIQLSWVAVILSIVFAFFYQGRGKIDQLDTATKLGFFRVRFRLTIMLWAIAIILAIALLISQFSRSVEITFSLALGGIGLLLALFLVYESARSGTTLKRISVLSVIFSGFVVALALVGSLVISSLTITLVEQVGILIIVLPIALIVAMFLLFAGVADLFGAIAGICTLVVAVAVFFALTGASYMKVLRNEWFQWLCAFEFTIVVPVAALATAVIIAVAIALTWVESGNRVIALAWVISLAGTAVVLTVAIEAFSNASNLVIAATIAMSIASIQLGAYIGWQAIVGNDKFVSVLNFALTLFSIGGTNFYNSNLNNVEFTQAKLKAANFRQAKINGTRWFGAKRLNRACSDSYLQSPLVQRLLVTGNGQNQKFDNLDLRGINLRGANLVDASFINTDLSEADLQGANLSRAKLLHTKLKETNLAIAQLTGAYIYNCELTPETKLVGVDCDYIYTQIPTKNNPDPGRKPELNGRIFKPGELAKVLISLYSTTTNPP
ncbi:pentapeptide repeat-containing protein [Tolypothrix sp. VBCCA 56010]|uniref:pentapeptide repeat-containing protein n=1 Tax=Tolypothrix sp. VBCCA 56010 TaxID=3137731 RepID=UPI003D7D6F85